MVTAAEIERVMDDPEPSQWPLNSLNSLNSHSVQSFPKIHQAAFYGLAGDIVEAIEPYSEADPVAILVNVLAVW